MKLKNIPAFIFESGGTIFGSLAAFAVFVQIINEVQTSLPSSLSPLYVASFLSIFSFWTLYGLRFGRIAIWLTNGIAAVAQATLLIIIIIK